MAHDEIVDRYSGLARAALAGESRRRTADRTPSSRAASAPPATTTPRELPDGALRASLGCGNPVAVAELRAGETVLDLGSGGGIDVLLSARRVGPHGKAYGLDASPDMLDAGPAQRRAGGRANVEFLHGAIEAIPLPHHAVDVVISNCVINLSDDKAAVLAEAFRVLRPGGRLGVSDVVTDGVLDPVRRAAAEQRIGCVAGSLTVDEYRDLLLGPGFVGIRDHADRRSRRRRAFGHRPGRQARDRAWAGDPADA